MLKQKAHQKLPTHLQWAKEHDALDEDGEFPLRRIMWGDEWKTITFVTDEFRYSIKFNSESSYKSACDELLDAFFPNRVLCTKLVYEGQTREMDVIIRDATELDNPFCSKGIQSDWGITFAYTQAPEAREKPARQKKRSAKPTGEVEAE